MVRPAKFAFNPQTASTNSFQSPNTEDVNDTATREFDEALNLFRNEGFIVEVMHDNATHPLPDSIFPNNWFSTHEGGKLILYPMLSDNRREERKPEIISTLRTKYMYCNVCDLTAHEREDEFLEGTGSVVFDHQHKIVFASVSPRTNRDVLLKVCDELSYLPFLFISFDRKNQPIYHTNVMLTVGPGIAVCCFEAIHDDADRYGLKKLFRMHDATVIDISMAQMESFAGNMLFIRNPQGKLYVAISGSAWNSLSEKQKGDITAHAQPIIAKIPTIEKHGGGSIRCMLAELY